MLSGIDLATSQRNLDVGLAFRLGHRVCYVKATGDNVGRYVAPWYGQEIDAAHAVFGDVGHYHVPNSSAAPEGAADYFTGSLRWRVGDFIVLDCEDLDGARQYSDAQAAVWFRRAVARLGISYADAFLYVGAADLRAHPWPACEALGVRLLVASYGANNGTRTEPNLGGRFGGVWAGHQYTSQGNVGGVTVDLNVFQDWAMTSTAAAGVGGITIIMGLSDEKYRGENASNVEGGATGFQFLDWTLTAAKNAFKRVDQLALNIFPWVWRGKLKDAAGKDLGTPESVLAQILAAVQAGGKVSIQLSEADSEVLAAKMAAHVPAGASVEEVRRVIRDELAKVFVAAKS